MFCWVIVNVVCLISFFRVVLLMVICLVVLILLIDGKLLVGSVVRVKWLWFVCMVILLLVCEMVIWLLLGRVWMILNNLWVGMVVLLFWVFFIVICDIIFIFRFVLVSESCLFWIWIRKFVRIGRVWWCLIMLMICVNGLRKVLCCSVKCMWFCVFMF